MLDTPLKMLLLALAGWMNREQLAVIDYLKEENRVLRELHGKRRLRFTDGQRRRLAEQHGCSRPPSWCRTRPVTVDSGQKQTIGTGVSGGALHSCSESSAVGPGEGRMGNVG